VNSERPIIPKQYQQDPGFNPTTTIYDVAVVPGYFSSDEEIQLHHNAQIYQQQNVPIFMTTYPQRGYQQQ
jgi:hypothetical protein